jgi:glycosyltransferase involved in cell wall biosynthesis
MNILFYISRFPGYGGIEKVTTVLANEFAKEHEVCILTAEKQEGAEGLLDELTNNVALFYLVHPFIIHDANSKQINELLKSKEIDVIIYQDSYAKTEGLLDCIELAYKPKIICVEHNTPDIMLHSLKNAFKKPIYSLYDFLRFLYVPIVYSRVYFQNRARYKHLMNISYKYVLLSNKFKTILRKMYGVFNEEKSIAIPNPLTIKSNINGKKEHVCLFVGRLTTQKGVDKLIHIWSLIEKHIEDWQLVIVGDGELNGQIKKQVLTLQLTNVIMVGNQNDVAPFYEKASILCMTSIFEGWGLVLTEAMSNGVVPIAFNSYATAEDIIEHEVDGVLVPPFDSKAYAEQLVKLIKNKVLRTQLSKKAIESSGRFSLKKVIDKWDVLLDGIKK